MEKVRIGIVSAPELPTDIARKIIDKLPSLLNKHIVGDITYSVDLEADPLVGAAENIDDTLDEAVQRKKDQQWDFVICITDLPIFSGKDVVAADASVRHGFAQISVPAFGSMPMRKRIQNAVVQMIKELYIPRTLAQESKKSKNLFQQQFPFSRLRRKTPNNEENVDVRFVISPRMTGKMRLVSGMTFANRPWTALGSFRRVLALAFATGSYISIFKTPWKLSVTYSEERFIILMIIAILSMVAWVIFAHNLWEKPTTKGDKRLRRLYNRTTFLTLCVAVIINYVVLSIMFLGAIAIFVSPELFKAFTGLKEEPSILYYFQLAWLVTSLGTLTGAIGAGLEDELVIRDITYGYRQKRRNSEIQYGGKTNTSQYASPIKDE
ncbi:hypothetical protein GLW08_02875 [Pontibacillus yanchengensis]|uniref:5,10-methylene-tetrahydrofolate dehydrogenase n=2 Tax=Pontibacillus yanchengensis TaxID=462910 RepID=A0A6I5A1G8_9BACI|nr:hypothetical protein [Pontibacillus yanchengensis]MYL34737.1 hypothetical protein [Pontibacillus yanchengensis]MYL52277.1 hypothetical protein [Pontibacillus yanchengensis]